MRVRAAAQSQSAATPHPPAMTVVQRCPGETTTVMHCPRNENAEHLEEVGVVMVSRLHCQLGLRQPRPPQPLRWRRCP